MIAPKLALLAQIAATGAGADTLVGPYSRGGGGRSGRAQAPNMAGKGPNGRVDKQVDNRDLLVQLLADFALHLDHEQGVPAPIEEVVVEAGGRAAEHLLPDGGEGAFEVALRGDVGFALLPGGGRQGGAVHFAVGGEGEGVKQN